MAHIKGVKCVTVMNKSSFALVLLSLTLSLSLSLSLSVYVPLYVASLIFLILVLSEPHLSSFFVESVVFWAG